MTNQIVTLNNPMTVSMADSWYEHTKLDHFWIRHRNAVLDRHFGQIIRQSEAIGEVGCGNGLILTHIAKSYKKAVDGLELNLSALRLCPTVPGTLYVYDILTLNPKMVNKYDLLMMIDVLEHIEEEHKFLLAVREHLKLGGFLIIGVPMRQHLYSAYDRADGHYRRYSTKYFKYLIQASGFKVRQMVQWGHIYIPLLMLRKFMLQQQPHISQEEIIRKGFAISDTANFLLGMLRYFDVIPNFNLTGASSFILAQKCDF
ncbi:hypothetical protein PCC6912_32340 [Chlorogloeopsis fritschii PCC 6912]|uniref:Methyltransferase n=1 Tax=Chlorogloeopsis fritschii PCC 6912 TaxID=211165 RepID=A0A433NCG3_CHLFR|nr:class I SAM-dependent methyltransferase [Chlorogloeopsis fritschii]RUR79698.1 hypothetical protein PCC6912_32340 [Chlorogloeopsis fritschii PCC 6912]